MSKILNPVRMDRCTGCGLCELAAARAARGEPRHGRAVKSKLSYSGSFLQIRRVSSGQPFFKAVVDYGQKTDYAEVAKICPEDCYEIEEG
ncbi:MAG: ferredoxin [candidate division WWE3 bacterium]|nr:ferredoxin [candidate division WWE3 bacterium]